MTAGAKLAVLEYDLEIPQAADWPGVAFPIFNPDGSLGRSDRLLGRRGDPSTPWIG
jgi:hypothetical protein